MKLDKEQREAVISKVYEVYSQRKDVAFEKYKLTKEGKKGLKNYINKEYPNFNKYKSIIDSNPEISHILLENDVCIEKEDTLDSISENYWEDIKHTTIRNTLKLSYPDRTKLNNTLILKSIENKDFNLEELVKELVNL